ncbi:MAG: hypothetical protein LUE93_13535, partial [Bacteroides sp.]|nr:hypothetical protein [Bacteroides sp.]
MKKFFPLLLLLFLYACDKKEEMTDFVYMEYHLPDHCKLDIEEEKAILINDKAEFKEVFSEYPEARAVNFNKYTMILVKGDANYGITQIERTVSYIEHSESYIFSIHVKMNMVTYGGPSSLAFLIPKTDTEDITLNVE